MTTLDYLNLFSGMMLLLYGISQVSANMQIIAGARLRTYLGRLTRNRLMGVVTGTISTALLQSSSATSVITVTLVGSGLISFTASLGVLLGANVGTTLTVQLISFSLQDYALFMAGVGAAIRFFGRQDRTIYIGRLVLGFGLIFLGMKFMGASVEPLRHNTEFFSLFIDGQLSNLWLLLGAFIFTAVVQASAATVALALSFAASGLIDFHSAMYIVVGSNIGTGVTALIASFGTNVAARKTALANITFNTIGALAIIPFLPLIHTSFFLEGDIARNIANFHTMFNLALTLVFLPLIGLIAWLMNSIIREPRPAKGQQEFTLDRNLLSTPDLAIQQARMLSIKMQDECRRMLEDTYALIESYDSTRAWDIRRRDDRLDAMNLEVRLYLTSLSHREMSFEESHQVFDIINYCTTLEYVGDVLVKNISKLARKLHRENIHLSTQGMEELRELQQMIMESFELATELFAHGDPGTARQLAKRHQLIRLKEAQLMQTHISRLQAGVTETIATTAIHTDLLVNFERISSSLSRFEPSSVRMKEEVFRATNP
ncbi:Na/Pi cotransporter family protein [Desulfurispira natronophila]|uniref:Phosphate:Na+ symporter n=1 Tax=Desulfurispira natronophila TaxID=682562 RepID=A0A7W7Y410_9BACT|nr:Na/Pi cotransporter family protein [Desulfurispira natronophila]MBB5021670.1 phosphate:Na+ symporter [Desulfurispira natronophila]